MHLRLATIAMVVVVRLVVAPDAVVGDLQQLRGGDVQVGPLRDACIEASHERVHLGR